MKHSIVHIVPAISNEASGPSYSVVRLCESLLEEGDEVTLAALDWAPMSSRPPFLKTFPLGAGPRRLGRSPAMKKWLKERVICDSIDLLHNHSIWMMPNVYPGQIAGRFGVPLIISPRGTLSEWAMANGSSFKGWFWRLFQRSALEAASCFHATARSEYEDIRRHGFRQPVAIIPNGVDIPTLKVKHQTERRSLLFLSRIHENGHSRAGQRRLSA